jgi:hypothetical protein
MNGMIIGVIVLVVVLIVGPFATLRAVSYYRDKRRPSSPAAPVRTDDEDDEDKPSGFW